MTHNINKRDGVPTPLNERQKEAYKALLYVANWLDQAQDWNFQEKKAIFKNMFHEWISTDHASSEKERDKTSFHYLQVDALLTECASKEPQLFHDAFLLLQRMGEPFGHGARYRNVKAVTLDTAEIADPGSLWSYSLAMDKMVLHTSGNYEMVNYNPELFSREVPEES